MKTNELSVIYNGLKRKTMDELKDDVITNDVERASVSLSTENRSVR